MSLTLSIGAAITLVHSFVMTCLAYPFIMAYLLYAWPALIAFYAMQHCLLVKYPNSFNKLLAEGPSLASSSQSIEYRVACQLVLSPTCVLVSSTLNSRSLCSAGSPSVQFAPYHYHADRLRLFCGDHDGMEWPPSYTAPPTKNTFWHILLSI